MFAYERSLEQQQGKDVDMTPGNSTPESIQTDIMNTIDSYAMSYTYEYLCGLLNWNVDDMLVQKLTAVNASKMKELEEKITHAKENEGETEVRDAMLEKANYLADIGDRDAANKAFEEAKEKTAGSGPKLDLVFSMLRLDLSRRDWRSFKQGLEEATRLCAKGGDWERKNKLKVYEALYLMATRQFAMAAELFLSSIATFTATELISYELCVFYTVVLAVVSLDRPALLENVVDNPEILSVIDATPFLRDMLMSLKECKYADFFRALAGISDYIRDDMLLYPHFRHYLKEARIVVYAQFLQSYKSVKLLTMAQSFGVSSEFLDEELAGFIVEGRLPAKIDRVEGVVETTRPDPRNAAYQSTIRQGDHLLNKIQKLSKIADLE